MNSTPVFGGADRPVGPDTPPLTRRAARAAAGASPVVLTEAQELAAQRRAERESFDRTVRPRGRRAAPPAVDEVPVAASVPVAATVPPVEGASIRPRGRRAGAMASDDPSASVSTPRATAGRRVAADSPMRVAVDAPKSVAEAVAGAGDAVLPKRRRRPTTQDLARKGFGAFAFLLAGGIAVATSVPAEAYFAATPDASISQSVQAQASSSDRAMSARQQLKTEGSASSTPVNRDSYGVTSIPKLSMAGYQTAMTFTNDPSGTIQWPFPTGVPISDGFGYRSSPGGIGSTNHQGIDFNPGMGAPIQAVADGVVRLAQSSDRGGFGCYVILDHNVNGEAFASLYAHMLCSSVDLIKGQVVKVGQQVGAVGSTGTSTGAHLHFEIHNAKDSPVDPFAWLTSNAN